MKNKQAIGFFDSGIGGTSIWKEVIELLPNENTIYLADSLNAPYGQKTQKEIIRLCIKNTDLLISMGCKIIIVACNTATTNAISILRNNYNIPFIGIEPAIKPAALNSKSGVIGILATKGTLSSKLFEKTTTEYTQNVKTVEQEGEGLVELIEDGKLDSEEIDKLLEIYLKPMLQKNIDNLVLGCTHYPYLIPQIRKIVGKNVNIIDSGKAVANQTKVILDKFNLLNKYPNSPKEHQFLINLDKKALLGVLKNVKVNYNIKQSKF